MEDYSKRFSIDFNNGVIRVFLISLVMGVLLSLFQMLRIQPLEWFVSKEHITSPQPLDIFEHTIKGKLQKIKNTFSLRSTDNLLIPKAHAEIDVPVAAYVVIDYQTGDIILDKNSDDIRKVASLTKIMTSIVALDLADPDESFVVTEKAAKKIPTKIGVVPGQRMTLSELLHATMLTSANDAAEVIKEGIDTKYGEEVFIRAMNEKARFLKLEHSSFDNAQGFDGRQNYSTARDFAVLSHYAMTHYPVFADIVKKDYSFLSENEYHKQFDLINWNGLIGVYPNVYGVKIGNTGDAGRTTIVVSEREGKHVMAVVLGADTVMDRDLSAAMLLDEAFKQKFNLSPVEITEEALLTKYESWNQYY